MGRTKRIIATRFSSLPIQRVLSRIIDGLLSPLEKKLSRFEIGQAKAKPYWFALCLADVFIFLQLDTPLFVALISEGRL